MIGSRETQRLDCPRAGKKRLPPALKHLQQLRAFGLQATATLWPPLQNAYQFVHQAKAILANPEQDTGQRIQQRYLTLLAQMRQEIARLVPLASAFEHFCHITDNFAAGLFQCYDVEGLPRTNNEPRALLWRRTGP
jgi:hypothetical protein